MYTSKIVRMCPSTVPVQCTSFNELYTYVPRQKCENVAMKECHTEYKDVCTTHNNQVTKYNSVEECMTVQEEVERKIPREVCNSVPKKECKQVPVTNTKYKDETKCHTVTEKQCTKVSSKSCNLLNIMKDKVIENVMNDIFS